MLQKFARDSLLGMTGGFIVWSIYFVAVYAGLSIGCVAGWDRTAVLGMNALQLILALLTLTALLLTAGYGWQNLKAARRAAFSGSVPPERAHRRFIASLAAALAGLALISTVWVGAPILVLAPCA